MVWLPMRQLSTKDQNDTDINNYRSPYGLQQWAKPIPLNTFSPRNFRLHFTKKAAKPWVSVKVILKDIQIVLWAKIIFHLNYWKLNSWKIILTFISKNITKTDSLNWEETTRIGWSKLWGLIVLPQCVSRRKKYNCMCLIRIIL